MCVIIVALGQSSRYPFIVAANRDEYYNRPAVAADYWPDLPQIIAGRDEQAGGTWLGLSRRGRFAAITNHHEPGRHNSRLQSRGKLVSGFLAADQSVVEYSQLLDDSGQDYNGYGLIFGDFSRLRYQTNRDRQIVDITEGVHGLSNHFLNTPWPRVEEGKRRLLKLSQSEDHIDAERIFDILLDSDTAGMGQRHPEQDASTTIPAVDPSRLPIFIRTKDYGTRSSSVILVSREGMVTFHERTFEPSSDRILCQRTFEYEIQ
ncbi:MAG: NRDE family protein [Acidiferrobacterales bacterium]|nr:NRDE family protein [Acidiferrobacterales bacterium]